MLCFTHAMIMHIKCLSHTQLCSFSYTLHTLQKNPWLFLQINYGYLSSMFVLSIPGRCKQMQRMCTKRVIIHHFSMLSFCRLHYDMTAKMMVQQKGCRDGVTCVVFV